MSVWSFSVIVARAGPSQEEGEGGEGGSKLRQGSTWWGAGATYALLGGSGGAKPSRT